MNLGKSIKVGCALKEVSQYEMAKFLGKSEVSVSNYVTSKTDPSISTVEKMAEFFGVKVSMFIAWGE